MPGTHPTQPFEAYRGSEPYIFVSYAHGDSELVLPEISRLHHAGYRIWYDEGIPPGENFLEEIAKVLESADLVLVFISQHAVGSRYVKQEIHYAVKRDKKLLRVDLAETALPGDLDLVIGNNQALFRNRPNNSAYWAKLQNAIPDSLRVQRAAVAPALAELPTPRQQILKGTASPGRKTKQRTYLRASAVLAAGMLILVIGFRDFVTVSLYRVGAATGSAHYMTMIGDSYLTGNGVAKDDAQALSWFRKAAEAGDAEGSTDLGSMYLNGQGVKKDDAQAGIWYRRAAEAGNAAAMTRLGALYEEGRGVTKNYSAAVSWYRKAAQIGDGEAIGRVGMIYEYGLGGARDDNEAVNWYRRSAQAGDSLGMTNLGNMFRYGQGVQQDFAQGVSWYRKAAEAGDERAMAHLGTMFLYGTGVSKDEAQAMSWFRRTNDPEARRGLAILKREEKEPPGDDAHRADRSRKAAQDGSAADIAMLGDLYEHGFAFLAKDEVKAEKLYRVAAEAGDEVGMLSLGAMYEHGLGGLAKDRDLAKLWYEKSLSSGRR